MNKAAADNLEEVSEEEELNSTAEDQDKGARKDTISRENMKIKEGEQQGKDSS